MSLFIILVELLKNTLIGSTAIAFIFNYIGWGIFQKLLCTDYICKGQTTNGINPNF